MRCKRCNAEHSWHDWAQRPYCSPYCKAGRPHNDEPVFGQWTRSTRIDAIGSESDFLQPLKKDGTINPYFVQKHGTTRMEKEMKLKKEQIMQNIERPRHTARELAAENNG